MKRMLLTQKQQKNLSLVKCVILLRIYSFKDNQIAQPICLMNIFHKVLVILCDVILNKINDNRFKKQQTNTVKSDLKRRDLTFKKNLKNKRKLRKILLHRNLKNLK